jgi:hypothetical protein
MIATPAPHTLRRFNAGTTILEKILVSFMAFLPVTHSHSSRTIGRGDKKPFSRSRNNA